MLVPLAQSLVSVPSRMACHENKETSSSSAYLLAFVTVEVENLIPMSAVKFMIYTYHDSKRDFESSPCFRNRKLRVFPISNA